MSDATLREQIRLRLTAFGDVIGRVHDYERWAVQNNAYLSLFQDPATKKIFGWEIMRTGLAVEKATMNKWKLVHTYMLRGYYGLEDSAGTEKAINALVDLLVLDFTRTPITGTQGRQFPEARMSVRMFGSVLCHVAEITLPSVAEIVSLETEAGEVDLAGVDFKYYLQPEPDDPPVVDAEDTVNL